MEPDQGEELTQYHHVRIAPVLRDGKLHAEIRLVAEPPCPMKILSMSELETLIADAQHVLAQLRWQYATYYIATETASMEHDTRHLVLREVIEHPTIELPQAPRALCGRELTTPYGRWAFSPLMQDVKTVYKLCRTCEHLYVLREKKTTARREKHV